MISKSAKLLCNTSKKSSLTLGKCLRSHFHVSTCLKQEVRPESDESIPWYLREENTSPIETIEVSETPELPKNSPSSMKEIVNLIASDYGLRDILILDLHELPEEHSRHPTNQNSEEFVIICSGKSEKHIYKAAFELKQYIKLNFSNRPRIEGMVSNSMSPVLRRRMAKRAKKGLPSTYSNYGIDPNTWVRCDLGVDKIVLHMLSPARRNELNLEQIYSEGEGEDAFDAPMNPYFIPADTDNVFHGIKRNFHTSTRLRNEITLQNLYDDFLYGSNESIRSCKEQFDEEYTGKSLREHNIRFDMYKIIKLLDSTAVTDEQIDQIIFDKYESLKIIFDENVDWNQQIKNDTINYMQLLLDSKIEPTESLSKLSSFLAKILKFKSDEIDLFSIDKFQSLLWALSVKNPIDLDAFEIQNIVEKNSKADLKPVQKVTDAQDNQIIQDIRKILKDYNINEKGNVPIWLREQILLSYGNLNKYTSYGRTKWDHFWKEWNSIIELIDSPELALQYWIRLLVYLVKLDDVDALRYLIEKHWNDNGSGRSFTGDYTKGEAILTDDERSVLKQVIRRLANQHTSKGWFKNVEEFSNRL